MIFSVSVIGWVVGYVALPGIVTVAIIYGVVMFVVLGGATINIHTRLRRDCAKQDTLICKLIRG